MINHPLFNEDDGNEERAARDIGYINIRQFEGSKAITLPNQWDPEELQTAEDLVNAVGFGRFELIGRHARTKRVVDRVMIELRAPKGTAAAPPEPAQQQRNWQPPEQQQYQVQQPPSMVAGGIQIPPGMDPQMAMMITMMTTSQQSTNAMLMAQREDSRFNAQQMTTLMLGFTDAQARMITGLVSGLSGRAPGGGTDTTADAFLKGVELMGQIRAGMAEGGGEGGEGKAPVWSDIAQNIAESLKAVRDIANLTSTTPAAPIVPPGDLA